MHRTPRAAILLTCLVPLALAGQAVGFKAEVAKKSRPCSNGNLKVKNPPLCKPATGIWRGTLTQQTPSGAEASSLEFEVTRSGRRRRVVQPIFEFYWYCGDERYFRDSSPFLATKTDRATGQFIDFGEVIQVGLPGSAKIEFYGDFSSKKRVKGTVSGTWDFPGAFGYPACNLTTRSTTWTATPA